jgi:hypothetical protein
MKIGSVIAAGIVGQTGVFEMKNFDPFTIAFWATLVGLILFAVLASFAGESIQDKLNQIRWHGIGKRIHLKEQ